MWVCVQSRVQISTLCKLLLPLGFVFRTPSLGLYWPRCRRSWRSRLLCSSPPVFTSFHNTGLLLLRCPAGYFGPRCLQTEPLRVYMPSPFKSMFARHERSRTEGQSGTGAPLRSSAAPPPRPPHPPPLLRFFPPLFFSSFSSSGRHPMGCALHHAHGGIIHGAALLLLSVLVPWF